MINNFAFLFSLGAVFAVAIRAATMDWAEQRTRLAASRKQQIRL